MYNKISVLFFILGLIVIQVVHLVPVPPNEDESDESVEATVPNCTFVPGMPLLPECRVPYGLIKVPKVCEKGWYLTNKGKCKRIIKGADDTN